MKANFLKLLPVWVIPVALVGSQLSPHLSNAESGFVPETAGTVTLSPTGRDSWLWMFGSRAPSFADGQAYLMGEEGERLGQLSTGFWFNSLVNAPGRGEIITIESYFSSGTRGERRDVLVAYDDTTLSPKREIDIPPHRMMSVRSDGLLNLTEDERFAIIVNYTPAQSISIVDLENGVFVEEVETPGCSVLYAAGNRDFHSICGNGGFLHIALGDDGRVTQRRRSEPIFDAVGDFLTISASRIGSVWYFVSRESNVYAIEMIGSEVRLLDSWSLVTEGEREDQWMISGMRHTAAHASTGELYVLMHQGEDHTFEEPGTHVWVYSADAGEKLREIELEDMAHSLALSQGSDPRLYTLDFFMPIPDLATLWIYLTEGEAALMEIVKQRASVYEPQTGEHLFYSDPVPRGGFVTNIRAWDE